MNIIYRGKNLEVTPALKEYAEDKLNALQKFLPPVRQVTVSFSVDEHHSGGNINSVEVMMYVPRDLFRAEESAEDMYAAVDLLIPKLKKQAVKYSEKRRDKRSRRDKEGLLQSIATLWRSVEEPPQIHEPTIVKRKRFSLTKPMSEKEAIEQMNLIGHSFYLFQNAESNRPSVVYRREDGNYGLIEPE